MSDVPPIYTEDGSCGLRPFERNRRNLHAYRMRYARAIAALQTIAAMGKKAGSETARHTLQQLGEPVEPEGYVPGRGWE